MRRIKRIFVIIFVIYVCFVFLQANKVQAIDIGTMETEANNFITKGETAAKQGQGVGSLTTSVTTQFTGLGQILTMVGAGIMVAATSYMGIKYIVSPPDKQAALKQQLVGLVVAGIVIFGAYAIWSAVVTIASQF